MFEKKLSVAEIAGERGLAVSTIESHLAYFVEQGVLAIDGMVDAGKRREIERTLAHMSGSSFGEIKQALGEGCSYGEIRMVQAYLKHLAKTGG